MRISIISMIAAVVFIDSVFAMHPANAETTDYDSFQLKPSQETVLFLSGLSILTTSQYAISKLHGPNLSTIDRHDVPSIELFTCDKYSKKLSYYSDNTRIALVGLTFLASLSLISDSKDDGLKAFITDITMLAEAEILVSGLTQCAKGISQRYRPYAYNENLSVEKRSSKHASQSFWSGHTSTAYMMAAFTGYVYQNRHPGSRLIKPVWITGLTLATATGILRVSSGNHFPSDVIVGAVAGSLVGWIVPQIHRERSHSLSIVPFIDDTTGLRLWCNF